VFHTAFPVASKEIESKRVFGGIDHADESMPKRRPLSGIDFAFEDGVLDSLAEVETGASDPPQSLGAMRGSGGYVVGDQDHHG
jgi:hypothetical protein